MTIVMNEKSSQSFKGYGTVIEELIEPKEKYSCISVFHSYNTYWYG
jgi:hypothetical protein